MFEFSDLTLKNLSSGAFLTAGEEKPNTMTIGWGFQGTIFAKDVFVVPVRVSRYTYELLENSPCFSVSFPDPGKLKKQLTIAGSTSGRDGDKWMTTGLTPAKCKKVPTCFVEECQTIYECKTIAKIPVRSEELPKELQEKWYTPQKGGDHILFVGEIIAQYQKL